MGGDVLKISNLTPVLNQGITYTQQAKKPVYQAPVISGKVNPEDRFEATKEKPDKSNDGKFSWSQAAKNFGKGLISPVTTMFSSVKNFAVGAGMIAAGIGLIVATGGAATPFLIGAGVAMGGFQLGTAVHKAVTAKDGDDLEKAFYHAGSATSTIGLSALGARASLKQAGVATEGMNIFSATAKCVASSKSSAVNTFNIFKSGVYKTNISNAVKPFMQTGQLKKLSTTLQKEGQSKFNGALEEIKSILPREVRGSVSGRSKGASSIHDKLARKVKKGNNIENIDKARNAVGDLVGTRLTLDDASPAQINKIVVSLANAIKKGDIKITEFSNYRGPGGKPYFTDAHINMLKTAARKNGQEIMFLEGAKAVKESGYTTAQLNIIHKNGALGEFQIRGRHINKLAELEHIPYDLRQGKDLSRGIRPLGKLFEPVKTAAQSLDDTRHTAYKSYLAKMYQHSRELELGLPTKRPNLPTGVDKILAVENLETLHNQAALITGNIQTSRMATPLATGSMYSGMQ